MLKSGKNNTNAETVDKTRLNVQPEPKVTLNWTYNYFSVGPPNITKDWQENLPLVLKETLYKDEE